jgi:hypothetical protein
VKSTRRNSEGTIKWGETWMGENVLRMRGRTGGEDDVVYDKMERISEVVWDEGRAGERDRSSMSMWSHRTGGLPSQDACDFFGSSPALSSSNLVS